MKRFAQSMAWKGKFPEVAVIDKLYQPGVKLTREAMAVVEEFLVRLPNLLNWFVKIICSVLALNT